MVCAVKSALLPVYPMPGAVDLSDGRDPPIPLFQCVVSSTEVEYPLFNIWFPARRDMETLNSPIFELFFDSWHMSCWIWRNRNESLIPLEKVEYELNQRGVFDSKSSGRKGSSTPGRTPSFKYQLKASFPYSLVWVLYRRIDIEKKCLYFLSKPTYLGISGYRKFEADFNEQHFLVGSPKQAPLAASIVRAHFTPTES